ncbi:glycosyl hydrolases family 31-domain-containing protein [Ilyonectria robusta]|uniref:glycosyl hydrolases family 31-domain-containing protein n=1 Tax=Ilyonectria robusta TaxID=1079257 RepID=UPI001E8D2043|nr:glycosyl hydrolases family 31-domain-containing protein [Ilyonectria robusta]KAH8667865.1 glycosyl hydrolases family 31-domain-containing protein [Ilyonectria robusta]
MFFNRDGILVYKYDAEQLWIQPWGPNAFRVRATKSGVMPTQDWALEQPLPTESHISISDESSSISNGKAKAVISRLGKVTIENAKGQIILEEYTRNRRDILDPKCSAIEVEARELRPIPGTDNYHLTMRLESIDPNEKIFGMGQYQQHQMNLKGQDIELAHRNSQASVPFALSSLGYGLLWNNPSIGRAVFGTNIMSFEAYSTNALDYWIVLGDTPAEIEEAYANATGKVPMMPEYGLGFWQCKLRYQTQEELLEVAREYQRRSIPLDLIVIDFFHWPKQGEWKFDPLYWPDPDAMVKELKEMKVDLMVSIWPTVDKKSENYQHMLEHGYLIRTDRGVRTGLDFEGETIHIDVTNPEARKYLWRTVKENYYSKGIKTFWLDEAEPEYTAYDFDNYRYFLGSNLTIGNIYPVDYAKAFYEGMVSEGQTDVVNLLRCAWAGSQKYGALVWSGDIASSWSSLRNQLTAGLNMGIAGLPWWTTDIGGFHGGDPDDDKFRELFVRWFQWGTFCPVMRLHGDREPRQPQVGISGGATCRSGAANEVWSYGPDVYDICRRYIQIREQLRGYTRTLMREAHEKGSPIMRPLFYEFPNDNKCWEISTQYMYGDKYLVCPVLGPEVKNMEVYLPPLETGKRWTAFSGNETYDGGQAVLVSCPLSEMPVFVK